MSSGPGPARSWATREDWVKHRPVITKHYRDENMKLKDLIPFMEEKYGLRATAKMYKDRIAKWNIAKNVKVSDIESIVKREEVVDQKTTSQESQPEFYMVGDRLIRADRLQQAMERRANAARRDMNKVISSRLPGTMQMPQQQTWHQIVRSTTPLMPQPSSPAILRAPEYVLQLSHGFVGGSFDSILSDPKAEVDIKLSGPVVRCWSAFEETLLNLVLVRGLDKVAFKSLNGAFDLLQPCLLDGDPQFVMVLFQMIALCEFFGHKEGILDILRMLIWYIADLSRVVLGPGHPVSRISQELKTVSAEEQKQICRLAAEATWHQLRGYLYPFKIDSFVHMTGTYADILDSLELHDEQEAFLRYVVSSTDKDLVPLDRQLSMQLNLVMCLRRQSKFGEAIRICDGVRGEIAARGKEIGQYSEDKHVDVKYTALRVSGLCECDGGSADKGRMFFTQALELMEEKKGRYSPRTTRALRDLLRYHPNETMRQDLEERLAHFSLENENFL